MKLFGVCGSPVLHSKSPLIFAQLIKTSSAEAAYTRVAADSSGEVLFFFNALGFSGMNITSPYKKEIVPYLAALDEAAALTGSVNTILRQGDSVKGCNTDHAGVVNALERRGIPLAGRKCVVLGAGGAAASAAFGLLKKGAEVILFNRTYEKARKTAEALGCWAVRWELLKDALHEADIFISAIPSGIECVRRDWLRKNLIVFEANYKKPTLLELAESAGCPTIKGEEWLLHQALEAWALFTGEPAGKFEIDFAALDAAGREKIKPNISLIGFMGCGKTSVGRRLAEKMDLEFFDSDAEIKTNEGMEIQKIFEKKGESYFRAKEKAVIEKLGEMKGTVFSCGGGAVVDPENRRLLQERSLVIFLFSTLTTCLKRAEGDPRPLLNHEHSLKSAEELFRKRKDAYFCAADLLVNGEKKIEEVSRKICDEIRQAYGN
ncbi:MAG: shikimate kinase [Candidatus Aminicenantales bacterium]